MHPPNRIVQTLESHGLPLGPLADPLRYLATEHGKLHVSANCSRVTKLTRRRLVERDLPAAQVTHARLCPVCRNWLPQPAQDHVSWCRAVEQALLALSHVGVASPYSPAYDGVAVKAANTERTWREVAALDKAAVALKGLDEPRRQAPSPELATILAEVRTLVDRTRSTVAAQIPAEGWTRPGQEQVVVALTQYTPQRRVRETLSSDELLARCTVVSALPSRRAYALADEPVARRLPHVLVLGPAEPTDGPEVLQTALRLLADRLAGEPVAFPDGVWLEALEAARLVHAPAA